jgi:hypothetical protein
MNEKAYIIERMTMIEEYHSAQTETSLCHYLHISHTEGPGFGLRSPGWEAGGQLPGTLHCQRVFYVLKSHENKRRGNAKWQFRPKCRKKQCVCLSVDHSTADDRNIHKALNISRNSWRSFCFNFYNIFYNLSFTWFTLVFCLHFRGLWLLKD